jgi:hypothetical protein
MDFLLPLLEIDWFGTSYMSNFHFISFFFFEHTNSNQIILQSENEIILTRNQKLQLKKKQR